MNISSSSTFQQDVTPFWNKTFFHICGSYFIEPNVRKFLKEMLRIIPEKFLKKNFMKKIWQNSFINVWRNIERNAYTACYRIFYRTHFLLKPRKIPGSMSKRKINRHKFYRDTQKNLRRNSCCNHSRNSCDNLLLIKIPEIFLKKKILKESVNEFLAVSLGVIVGKIPIR